MVQKGNGHGPASSTRGRRPLAYEVEALTNKRGVYVYVNYLGDGALVADARAQLPHAR